MKVWVRARKGKRKTYYDLRWIDCTKGKWRSKSVGTDKHLAERKALELETELTRGTYRETKRISWGDFVADHVAKIEGRANAVEANQVLSEFGKMMGPQNPASITFAMSEAYIVKLQAKGLKAATINKKITYLRAAINKAIRRGCAATNPISSDLFRAVENKPPREITPAEEIALLESADCLYGARWRAFIFVALNTGARRGELLTLPWERIDLEAAEIHLAKTKTHNDRIVPINADVVAVLRRSKVQTQIQGGPFIGMGANVTRAWKRIVRRAKVAHVTIHDMRRSYISRLIRCGSPMAHVQRLAGHKNPSTTLKYYTWISGDDLRATVAKLSKVAG